MTSGSRRRLYPALLCMLSLLGAAPATPPSPAPALSATADTEPALPADFSFTDMRGGTHTLAEFRGKPVLLEFWASWCIPCRKGFPWLDTLAARYHPEGLQVIAVSLETDDDAVYDFITSFPPTTFLVGRDPSGKGGEVFAVAAMPTSVLLGPDGREIARFEGGTETVHGQTEEALDAYLHGDVLPASASEAGGKRKGPNGNLRAWQRGYLADPIMSLDGDMLTRSMREHIHASKEGAAGNGGVSGGGCGCN